MFVREDWTLFRQLSTLGQKAGVSVERIPELVAKELVDNALDAAGSCDIEWQDDGSGEVVVYDEGDGIPGTDEEIAALFSIGRPLTSSKLLRLPTRGALGNGLRVVAGAVLASDGWLQVSTRGRTLELKPQDDGTTSITSVRPYEQPGTCVAYGLGLAVPYGDPFDLSRAALVMSDGGPSYAGKSSPFWFDSDAWFELLQASEHTARELVAGLEGCSGKAGAIAAAFSGRAARSLDRDEADALLGAARQQSTRVRPARLGWVGQIEGLPAASARGSGFHVVQPARGRLAAELPFTLEAWAERAAESTICVCVNRTRITGRVGSWNDKGKLVMAGAGIKHFVAEHIGRGDWNVWINVQTPYVRLTSDGKDPDLFPIAVHIAETVGKAIRIAKRTTPTAERGQSQKSVTFDTLEAAIAKASGDGMYRFSIRQLFYAVRPTLLEMFGKEPNYNYFSQELVTEYEAEHGEIPGMYRDPRGTLYHPHTRQEIPLGTIAVEQYARPAWTFNKILYSEKEGFFSILRSVGWPERNDCALLTSKGVATRAARDVLDLLGESDEELTFFCIHDADGPGTVIYEALAGETAARPARRVRVINLGLEPKEAVEMGLQVETFERPKRVAVGSYVDAEWTEWLQTQRVELNAMTTGDFIAWLDRKMAEHDRGRLVPPAEVLDETLRGQVEAELRDSITERVLREADVDAQVDDALEVVDDEIVKAASDLENHVRAALDEEPAQQWIAPVRALAGDIAEALTGGE